MTPSSALQLIHLEQAITTPTFHDEAPAKHHNSLTGRNMLRITNRRLHKPMEKHALR